jgi:hypothetical protein
MKRLIGLALALLASAAVEAGGGGGSGGPSTGSPLPVGDGDPAPPSGDPPGSSSGGSGSSGNGACPCAGSYSCDVSGLEAGVETIDLTPGDGTCQWSSGMGGSGLQLGCNDSTSDNGYQYTSSWSGSTLTLCLDSTQGEPSCVQCTSDGTGQ